jgi:RHS repeat-associated protein
LLNHLFGVGAGGAVGSVVDLAGHPATARIAGGAVLVSSEWHLPFGPITSIVFGNGTTKTMQYDSRYRVTENKLTGPSLTIADYVYTQDAAGNITAIHDAVDATYDRTFTYADLSRLTGAATGASLWRVGTYTYDAMGNMITRSLGAAPVDDGTILSVRGRKRARASAVSGYVDTTSFTDQSTTPKLAAVTTNGLDHTLTYDAAGNEVQYYASRTYSPRNELASVIDASDEVTQHRIDYGYDGRGVRVMRSESPVPAGAAHRYFFYTPEPQLLATTVDDADNPWSQGSSSLATPLAMNAEITWFAGLPVAEFGPPRTPQNDQILTVRGRKPRPASLAATTLYYTFTDHLGTPLLQTDATGTIAWRVEYEPFGNVWKTRSGNSADQPLRFPGQELALTWEGGEENYNIFRWYRSGWGRYTQVDPILGKDANANDAYGYARRNPLGYTDPTGLLAEVICSDIAAGSAGIMINTPFYHCRLRVTCKECASGPFGGPFDLTVGLERNRKTGALYVDEQRSYSGQHFDLGISEADSCNFGKCVRTNAAVYKSLAPGWASQYAYTGPNSNTFAGHLARTCGSTKQPYWAPGWNEPPFFK